MKNFNPVLLGAGVLILVISGFIIVNRSKSGDGSQSFLTNNSITEKKEAIIPLLQEKDLVQNFFTLIDEGKASDAVMMMTSNITGDDATKQAFGVQFAAMDSVKTTKIEESSRGDWTETWHQYMVTLDIVMNPSSAGGPIPYYGYEKGENIRFITLIKEGGTWKVEGISTGP